MSYYRGGVCSRSTRTTRDTPPRRVPECHICWGRRSARAWARRNSLRARAEFIQNFKKKFTRGVVVRTTVHTPRRKSRCAPCRHPPSALSLSSGSRLDNLMDSGWADPNPGRDLPCSVPLPWRPLPLRSSPLVSDDVPGACPSPLAPLPV